jgi:hypothetical protein
MSKTPGAAIAAAILVAFLPHAASAQLLGGSSRVKLDREFTFPAGQPVRIVVFRPDVSVGALTSGGVQQANAEWTESARSNLVEAVRSNLAADMGEAAFLGEQDGKNAAYVTQYQSLFRAVGGAIVTHKFGAQKLPTKKGKFDWTLGPGAAHLGEIGNGNYGLFLYTKDNFGTGGRKALQIIAAFARVSVPAGIHQSYAALIDLATGQIVWFNVDFQSGGDPRTSEGAAKRIGQLLKTLPGRGKRS